MAETDEPIQYAAWADGATVGIWGSTLADLTLTTISMISGEQNRAAATRYLFGRRPRLAFNGATGAPIAQWARSLQDTPIQVNVALGDGSCALRVE